MPVKEATTLLPLQPTQEVLPPQTVQPEAALPFKVTRKMRRAYARMQTGKKGRIKW